MLSSNLLLKSTFCCLAFQIACLNVACLQTAMWTAHAPEVTCSDDGTHRTMFWEAADEASL